jgi:hypothetical protein
VVEGDIKSIHQLGNCLRYVLVGLQPNGLRRQNRCKSSPSVKGGETVAPGLRMESILRIEFLSKALLIAPKSTRLNSYLDYLRLRNKADVCTHEIVRVLN